MTPLLGSFSHKYLRNLPNEKKAKEAPLVTSYLYVLQNIGVFYSKRYDSAAFKCN